MIILFAMQMIQLFILKLHLKLEIWPCLPLSLGSEVSWEQRPRLYACAKIISRPAWETTKVTHLNISPRLWLLDSRRTDICRLHSPITNKVWLKNKEIYERFTTFNLSVFLCCWPHLNVWVSYSEAGGSDRWELAKCSLQPVCVIVLN